jgi:[ribosomal protein S5]-alanine N-acetyltransferase
VNLPRLAGERVVLVPVPHDVAVAAVSGDQAALARALSPLGLHSSPGWPHDDTADALRPDAEHGGPGPSGSAWLVVADDLVVGDCGWLGGIGEDGRCELGYGLCPEARGQGLGTEAVGVLAAWVEQQPGVDVVTADVLPDNTASLRLLERLGFTRHGTRAGHVVLERPAPGRQRRIAGRHVC